MRKMAAVLLCLLLLAGCGGGWETACAAAGRLVSDWDAAELNCYGYEGRAGEWEGGRCFVVTLRPCQEAFAGEGQLREHLAQARVRQCVASVQPDLAACFEGLDAHMVFVICDEEGAVLYTFVDGELVA